MWKNFKQASYNKSLMEVKKTNKANLEKSRGLRVQLGIILVVSVILFVMQYDTKKKTTAYNFNAAEIELELELDTHQSSKKISRPLPKSNFTEIYSIINQTNIDDTSRILLFDNYNNIKPVDLSFDESSLEIEEVYNLTDRPAEFPGGKSGLSAYLNNNLHYPEKAKELNIQGSVLVKFTIDNNGAAKEIELIGKVHYLLDEEAVRLIKKMPKWNPAFISGKYTDYKIVLPINFMLNNYQIN